MRAFSRTNNPPLIIYKAGAHGGTPLAGLPSRYLPFPATKTLQARTKRAVPADSPPDRDKTNLPKRV